MKATLPSSRPAMCPPPIRMRFSNYANLIYAAGLFNRPEGPIRIRRRRVVRQQAADDPSFATAACDRCATRGHAGRPGHQTSPRPPVPTFTKRAIPTARNIEAARAWRNPTNMPAPARSTRPATPGDASAASASNDNGASTASTVCWRIDRSFSGTPPSARTTSRPTRRVFGRTTGRHAPETRGPGRRPRAGITRCDQHLWPVRLHRPRRRQLCKCAGRRRACRKAPSDAACGAQRGDRPVAHHRKPQHRQQIPRHVDELCTLIGDGGQVVHQHRDDVAGLRGTANRRRSYGLGRRFRILNRYNLLLDRWNPRLLLRGGIVGQRGHAGSR